MKFIFILLLLLPFSVFADIAGANGQGITASVINAFQVASADWGDQMQGYALWLFMLLASIAMVWRFGMLFLQGADIGVFIAEFTKFSITLGFFVFILQMGTAIAVNILQTFGLMAGNASGFNNQLNPSDIMDGGFTLFKAVFNESSIWSPVDAVYAFVLAAVIMFFLARVCVDMVELLISGYLLIYGGVFLLGFAGAHWTSDIAINYLRKILAVGVQYMGMIFIIGVGKGFVDLVIQDMQADGIQLDQMLILAVATFFLFRLSHTIPNMLASIVGYHGGFSGIGNSSISSSLASTAAAMGVAATAMHSAAMSMRQGGGSGGGASSSGGDSGGDSGGGSLSGGVSQQYSEQAAASEAKAKSLDPVVNVGSDGKLSFGGFKSDPKVAKAGLNQAREALRGGNAKT